MSPFSSPVLLGAALVTSPSWWRLVEGTGSLSVATTRYLVAIGVCWLALEVVTAMVGPVDRPSLAPAEAEETASATGAAPGTSDGPAAS